MAKIKLTSTNNWKEHYQIVRDYIPAFGGDMDVFLIFENSTRTWVKDPNQEQIKFEFYQDALDFVRKKSIDKEFEKIVLSETKSK